MKKEKMQVIPIVEKKDVVLQVHHDYYDFNVDGISYTAETLKNHFVVNTVCLDALKTVFDTFAILFKEPNLFGKERFMSSVKNRTWETELARVSYLDGDYSDNDLIDYFKYIEYYGNQLLKEAKLFGNFVITFDKENPFDFDNRLCIYSKSQYIDFLNETLADYEYENLKCQVFSEFAKQENLTVEDLECVGSDTFNQNLDNEDDLVCMDIVFIK